ncbi:MAG: hypothetical protein ABIK10_06040 [candidate division WOR-3 bacterium]
MKKTKKDLASLEEKNIKVAQELLAKIYELAQKYRVNAYLVGGPVRDFLMAQEKTFQVFKDLDIALTNYYQEIGNELAVAYAVRPIIYPQFMTMTITLADFRIDIAQTRKEVYLRPAQLPLVAPATIDEDLGRRDFTVNAMAILLTEKFITNAQAEVLDPFGGQADIKNKLIRILHPKSFVDDPTRIFRALRFALRLGFKLEKLTEKLMTEAISQNLINLLSGERIFYEFDMICKEKVAHKILAELQKRKVIKQLYKVNLLQDFFSQIKNLSSSEKLIYLFSHFPYKYYQKYPLKKEFVTVAQELNKRNMLIKRLRLTKRPSTIYFLLKPYHLQTLQIIKKTTKDKSIRKKLECYFKLKDTKLATSGKTLKQYNVPPGPLYAKILNKLLAYKLDGKIKTPQDEERYLKALLRQ